MSDDGKVICDACDGTGRVAAQRRLSDGEWVSVLAGALVATVATTALFAVVLWVHSS